MSVVTGSVRRFSAVGSSRVRVSAIVSPERWAEAIDASSPEGTALTMAPEFSAPPRRGLWQPSQVRRSPGRTWIQLVWVWNARPCASMTDSARGVSAGTLSLNEPSGSIGA